MTRAASPEEALYFSDPLRGGQTRFAFGTPTPHYTANGQMVWPREPAVSHSYDNNPLYSSLPPPFIVSSGDSIIGSMSSGTPPIIILAVVGHNKSAARQFFRIQVHTAGNPFDTNLVCFPVEGLQAFSYDEPIKILSTTYTQYRIDFAADANPLTATTVGAFSGTVYYG